VPSQTSCYSAKFSCRTAVAEQLIDPVIQLLRASGYADVVEPRDALNQLVRYLAEQPDRTDEAAYAGLGLRGFLTDRFLVQAEYRKFQVFTSRDENEEPDSWTVAFTYFF